MEDIKYKIINGYKLKKKEAIEVYRSLELEELYEIANEVRQFFMGRKMDLCTIMNVKSGKCSEDCRYCAQSAHYETGIEEYSLINEEEIFRRAKENAKYKVDRFSLVTSGKGISDTDLDKLIDIYKKLNDTFPEMNLCASHGIITYEQAAKLKKAGVKTYHHNLETSKRFYQKICTTHTYKDRTNTILNATKAGLTVCSGGIIGMGETVFDRINMAYELKKLGVKSIPINVLMPVHGTPFGDSKILEPTEILRTIAIYRLILPDANIRFAGGRIAMGEQQKEALTSGLNGVMVGNYLTTTGNSIEEDLQMIKELGFTTNE
ncbi:biotin synthase [Vallitalea longa]|uniref:Biotin synthase n=1 Tax=Vallitalea longa TaxID=2936439 RepID=A0A9W5YDK6_9FIRM|nr:biotin synthase BioB [Vallitalea longa]GKX30398.1 biotin synthase [Vallitalea longa]